MPQRHQWPRRKLVRCSPCQIVPDLDELVHSDEGFLEVVEGGGVQHLLLDLGRVRAPVHQEQLLFL